MAQLIKNLPANAGDARDAVSTPGLGRFPGEASGNAPVFVPGKLHGERSLLRLMGHKESDMMDSMH